MATMGKSYEHSGSFWKAECQTCPTTIGVDYGQTVYVGIEVPESPNAESSVRLWAGRHERENPDHEVRVARFVRILFDTEFHG